MSKEKIYLIPGLMTDERLWSRIKPILEDKYELVHLPVLVSEDFDEICQIILDKIEDEKINILGFSLGGYTAAYFAFKYPHKVNRLFLVAATPSATNEEDEVKRKAKLEIMKTQGFSPLGYEKAKSLVEVKNQNDSELITTIEDMYNDLGMDTFITQMNSTFNRIDLLDDLSKMKIPVWFFLSDNDRLLNKEALSKLSSIDNNLEVIIRVGTSHNIPLEEPAKLSELIINWMNKR